MAVPTTASASSAASGAAGAPASCAGAAGSAHRQHDQTAHQHHARGRDQGIRGRTVARDDRVDRVADRAPQHRELVEQSRALAAQLQQRGRADEDDQPDEAEQKARCLGAVEALAADEEMGQHHGGQRHDAHQDAGETAVDALLAEADQPERHAVAGEREGCAEQPEAAVRREALAASQEDQPGQQQRSDRQSHGDQRRRREAAHRDAGHHERAAPHRDQREQQEPMAERTAHVGKDDPGPARSVAVRALEPGRTRSRGRPGLTPRG